MIKRRPYLIVLIMGCALLAMHLEGCSGSGKRHVQFSRRSGRDNVSARVKARRQAAQEAFEWPLADFTFMSGFGIRHGRRHDGVDLAAKSGSPVKAVAPGKVVFSKRMRGYGNLVLIKHDNGYFTAYAHNRKNLVGKGDTVKQGQLIAEVGRTGRATGNHLHFEIRKGQTAIDPVEMLPACAGVLVKRKTEEGPIVARAGTRGKTNSTKTARVTKAKTATERQGAKVAQEMSSSPPTKVKKLAAASLPLNAPKGSTDQRASVSSAKLHIDPDSKEIEEVLLKEMVLPESGGAMMNK